MLSHRIVLTGNAALFILLVALSVWGQAGESAVDEGTVSVEHATLREPLPGKTVTAAYFEVTNTSRTARELVAVEAGFAARAELHEHRHENGMMRMRQIPSVTLPAGETVLFEPGGYHVMLFELSEKPERGATAELVLRLASGERVAVEATVVSVMDASRRSGGH